MSVAHQPTRAEAAVASRTARTKLLLEAPIGPTLARLAAPNVIAMVVSAAMSVAEGVFAGFLGVSALAGMALVFPLVMLAQMLSAGSMGGAISSAIARALGAGDAKRAGQLVAATWIIAVVMAAIFAAMVLLFGPMLFTALGGGGAAVEEALTYAYVAFPAGIALWLCHATLSVMRGAGNMATPSLVLLIVSLGSIPLSGALALGWGGLPSYGMAGLAAGQALAFGIGAIAAIAYVASGRAGLSASFRGLHWGLFKDILRVGIIASLNAIQTVLTVTIMVALVGTYGEAALAGYGLGARLEFLMVPVVFGVGAAMTSMVGANVGAGNRARALKIGWAGSCAAAAIVGSVGLFFAIFPDIWLRLFVGPEATDTLEAGRTYFRIVAPFYAFFALGLALYFASQGAGRMIWPVAGSVLRMGVAIGGAVALTSLTDLGLTGVFIGVAMGMCAYGVFTALAIRITRWR